MDLCLRRANSDDRDILFKWVNDQLVRQSTLDTHTISYEEYSVWFDQMLCNPNQIQYIMMEDNTPVGRIRLAIEGESAEIDYSISNEAGNLGYGQEIIRLAIEWTKQENPGVKKLIGRIKPSNTASYYCFTSNGFEEVFQQLEYDMDGSHDVYEPSQEHGSGTKVLFLTNNRNTLDLFEWISERCYAELESGRMTPDFLRSTNPDLVISYNYIYMISGECIEAVSGNIINMHISLLPWNRGFSPNIWSFIDDTPKGVTIHMLSEGLDEGDILFQDKVVFDPERETLHTTYQTLNEMIVALLKRNWDIIISNEYKKVARKQEKGGSYHTIADLKKLTKEIPFEWTDNINEFLKKYRNHKIASV